MSLLVIELRTGNNTLEFNDQPYSYKLPNDISYSAGMARNAEAAANESPPINRIQVNPGDTEELIRLTESLDELSTKIDRIGGVVVKLYQMTERLESTISKLELPPNQQLNFEAPVIEWIQNKIEKKRRKELKKWRKKKGKKRKNR